MFDTIVIGAGVMGCSIALRLVQAGQKVLILEKAVPGAEASSAAAGILGPQVEAEEDGPLFRLGLASRALYPDFTDEIRELSGQDVGFRRSGVLSVARTAAALEELVARRAWQASAGLAMHPMSGDELRCIEPALGHDLAGALHFPDDAQVDAQALAAALPVAVRRMGASIERATVTGIELAAGKVTGVSLDSGNVAAGAVVVAAGAWTSLVVGAALPADAVVPVRGQIVRLVARTEQLPHAVVFGGGGYLVPRDAGRVLLGSTMEKVGFEKRVTAGAVAAILGNALSLVPGLASAAFESAWAGFRPSPRDGLPLLGATATPGLFVASGHHRNGILLTPRTANWMADAVLGRASSIDSTPFRPDRFQL